MNDYIRYSVPESNQILELSKPVLQLFESYRQTGNRSEAGGLLFAQCALPKIIIKEATGPSRKDKRSKFSFVPFRATQRKCIYDRFKLGLHFVGEWHTHPEIKPIPSKLDLDSMYDSFIKSKHELNAFIMIIVGTCESDINLWISLHNRTGFTQLRPL